MMIKVTIENYKIFVDGKPIKKVTNLDKPIKRQREDKTHYFRYMAWIKSKNLHRS